MVPAALAGVAARHLGNLLGHKDLADVVHLVVTVSVVVFPLGMGVDGTGRIQFEAHYAHIHKGGQVVGPVLHTGSVPAFADRDEVFLNDTGVVFLAEPQAQFDSHAVELTHEQARIILLGHLVLHPVRFGGEAVVVPLLLGGEIVALGHPLGLQPEKVYRHAHIPEMGGIVEDGPLVFPHVGAEGKAIGPAGEYIASAGDLGIEVEDGGHVRSRHQVEIGLSESVVDVEGLGIGIANVKVAFAGGVVVDAPAAGAHHEGHGNLRMLVGGPHPQQFAAVLDVLAGGAAASVETLTFFHGEGNGAGCFGISGVQPGATREFAFIIADDAVVHGDEEVGEFLVDGIGQDLYRSAAGLEKADLADQDATFGILKRESTVGCRNRQGTLGGLENMGSGGLLQGIIGLGPVLPGDAVTVHKGLGESAAGRYLYVEDAIGTNLYFQGGSSGQFHFVDRVGFCGQANDEQLGCQ